MEKRTWKSIAIVFMIIFFIETVGFIWLIGLGTSIADAEMDCAIACENNGACSSYAFDSYNMLCELHGFNGMDDYVIKTIRFK